MTEVAHNRTLAMGSKENTRKLVRHPRDSGVHLGPFSEENVNGTATGKQTYSIRLPAKNALPPEVWFAATIFEMIAYPYHVWHVSATYDMAGGFGGAPGGMEMTRQRPSHPPPPLPGNSYHPTPSHESRRLDLIS